MKKNNNRIVDIRIPTQGEIEDFEDGGGTELDSNCQYYIAKEYNTGDWWYWQDKNTLKYYCLIDNDLRVTNCLVDILAFIKKQAY